MADCVLLILVLRGWDTMQKLLLTILATLVDLMYFTGVLVLFVFVYAMAAKQIFSGKMVHVLPCSSAWLLAHRARFCQFFADDDGNLVRSRNHFDSLGWSVVTTFQVLIGLLVFDQLAALADVGFGTGHDPRGLEPGAD